MRALINEDLDNARLVKGRFTKIRRGSSEAIVPMLTVLWVSGLRCVYWTHRSSRGLLWLPTLSRSGRNDYCACILMLYFSWLANRIFAHLPRKVVMPFIFGKFIRITQTRVITWYRKEVPHSLCNFIIVRFNQKVNILIFYKNGSIQFSFITFIFYSHCNQIKKLFFHDF